MKSRIAKMRLALVAVAMMGAFSVASAKGGGGCGDGGSAGGGGGGGGGASAGSGDSAGAGSSTVTDGTWLRRTRRTPTLAEAPAPETQGTVAIGSQSTDGTTDATRLRQ